MDWICIIVLKYTATYILDLARSESTTVICLLLLPRTNDRPLTPTLVPYHATLTCSGARRSSRWRPTC